MSDLEKLLLEDMRREWYEKVKEQDLHHCQGWEEVTNDGFIVYEEYTFERFVASPMVQCCLAVLKRKVLPLLEAGQAMRTWFVVDEIGGAAERWDAALEKAKGK